MIKVSFTERFYNKSMVGSSKTLPDYIALALIQSGEAVRAGDPITLIDDDWQEVTQEIPVKEEPLVVSPEIEVSIQKSIEVVKQAKTVKPKAKPKGRPKKKTVKGRK